MFLLNALRFVRRFLRIFFYIVPCKILILPPLWSTFPPRTMTWTNLNLRYLRKRSHNVSFLRQCTFYKLCKDFLYIQWIRQFRVVSSSWSLVYVLCNNDKIDKLIFINFINILVINYGSSCFLFPYFLKIDSY